MYVAHRTEDEPVRLQSVSEHLLAVRDLCEDFGRDIGLAKVFGLTGWLHDAGKYSDKFQTHIGDAMHAPNHDQVNHAFAGARLLEKLLNAREETGEIRLLGAFVENVVMAHHNSSGAYDFLDLRHEDSPFLKRKRLPITDWTVEEIERRFFSEFKRADFLTYLDAALAEMAQVRQVPDFAANQYFYLRALDSALVDADHLDTALFASQQAAPRTDNYDKLVQFNAINESKVAAQAHSESKLNQLRQAMSDRSHDIGQQARGSYSLSVPTGGGKTLSSLRFALQQAVTQHLNQIIYIVPFTTVIEQNAAVIRERLDLSPDDYTNVLEYHSTVVDDNQSFNYYYARDTWDAPIIVTTQVAYLNALYGAKSRNSRHMHRLLNAVLIFDEIQSLPIKTMAMNNAFLNWIAKTKLSTSLLCTATQPALDSEQLTFSIEKPQEIVENLPEVEHQFERVQVISHLDDPLWAITDLSDFLSRELNDVNSVLVVLNTKKAVRDAYAAFDQPGVQKFHLSTAMVVAHRKAVFKEIKAALLAARASDEKVVVFSTKLIEAGVDLSFESVVRSLAGLDSVIQVAGRCNRNHERPMAYAHLIEMDPSVERLGTGLGDIKKGADQTKRLVAKYGPNGLMSSERVKEYFKNYFDVKQQDLKFPVKISPLNERVLLYNAIATDGGKLPNYVKNIRVDLRNDLMPTFTASQSVAENFNPIDSATKPVLIQWQHHNEDLVTALLAQGAKFNDISRLLKQAQNYIVQVYGDPVQIIPGVKFLPELNLFLAPDDAYSDEYGLGQAQMSNYVL